MSHIWLPRNSTLDTCSVVLWPGFAQTSVCIVLTHPLPVGHMPADRGPRPAPSPHYWLGSVPLRVSSWQSRHPCYYLMQTNNLIFFFLSCSEFRQWMTAKSLIPESTFLFFWLRKNRKLGVYVEGLTCNGCYQWHLNTGGTFYLVESKLQHQSVRHKLNVLLHHVTVHPNQLHWQGYGQELLKT